MSDNPNTKRQGYGNPALRGTINRAGRSPSSKRLKDALEEKDVVYGDIGVKELNNLYRKSRVHLRKAISVMAHMMEKPDASDTAKIAAAKVILDLSVGLINEMYMKQKDRPIDPASDLANQEDQKPAVIVHLRSVKPGESSGEDRKIGELNPSDNK